MRWWGCAGTSCPAPGRCLMVAQGSLQSELAKKVYARAVLAVPVLMAVFFIPAGTFAYWQAWLYLACLLIPMFFVFRYLLKHDPQLLERRMQTREWEPVQQRVILLSTAYFLLVFILP